MYRFTPENRIAMIQGEGSGKVLQHARFDASGHRWAREGASDGGKGNVSLRDASGQVVAEYVESSADSGLELTKEYVRGGPGLLAEYSTCGPRPGLALNSPYENTTDVRFIKTDFVPAAGDYTILIEAEDGRQKTLSRPSSLTDQFTIPISDFYSGVDNFVRLQTEASCGVTGYGNAVSYHREAATGCLQTMTSYRTHLGDGDDLSHLHIATSLAGCPAGTLFNMYFEREGTTQPVSLNPIPAPITSVILPNLPAGASHGRYWVAAFDPQTGAEFKDSPAVNDGSHSTGADTGSEPGEASRNLRFAHLDHLGSTRVITDEAGAVVAELKFYPFGMEAETSGGDATRMKFTGHERDGDVHVDYMLARYYAAGLGRFLSVDPLESSARAGTPGTWNRYAYVLSSPTMLVDPDGRSARGKAVVALIRGFKMLSNRLSRKSMVRVVKDGDDVIASSRPMARDVAKAAGDGARPTHHTPHKSAGEGARAHYHPKGSGAHVFYSLFSAVAVNLTLEHHARDRGPVLKGLAMAGDFFSPLSVPYDVVLIADEVFGEEAPGASQELEAGSSSDDSEDEPGNTPSDAENEDRPGTAFSSGTDLLFE